MLTFTQFFSSVFLILATLFNSFIPLLAGNQFTEHLCYDNWSSSDAYVLDYDNVLKKDADKDFKILVLADTQLDNDDATGAKRFASEALITALVEKADPDLIVTVGDNAIGGFAYQWFIDFLDSFGIPWAPIMGNHDGQGLPDESWAAYKMTKADNCLFEFGPKDMGHGNYVLHISQNNKIIHTLYLMDSHDSTDYFDGTTLHEDVYDGVWKNQIEWYKWNVNGLNTLTNSNVQSTVFMHIPFPEYNNAFDNMNSDPTSFGEKNEYICCGINRGMFDVIKELGSTKDVICGHDHVNTFSTVYEGVRLSYALKSGLTSYYDEAIQGASLLTIDNNGATKFSHIDATKV